MDRPLVFLSSDPISLPCLDRLVVGGADRIAAVVTAPDRPRGRGQRHLPNAVAARAAEVGLRVEQPEEPGAEVFETLRDGGARLGIVFSFGRILRRRVLEALPDGFVNLHASPLPRLRGASPIETAVALGWRETAVTLMRVVRRMDAGPMGPRIQVSIGPEDTGGDLRGKVASAAADLLEEHLDALLTGSVTWTGQDEQGATYCRRLTKEDGSVAFGASAREAADRVRAFTPSPGAWFEAGGVRLRVRQPAVLDEGPAPQAPGTFLGVAGEFLSVSCAPGVLGLGEVQRPGGRWLPAAEFLRGFPLPVGEILGGATVPPFEMESP